MFRILKHFWLAIKGSCILTVSAVLEECYNFIFKRWAKQIYYICTAPFRLEDYESAAKDATHAALKPMSNCEKNFHISCPIHVFNKSMYISAQ